MRVALLLWVAAAACSGKPAARKDDAGVPRDAAPVEVTPRTLGLADLAGWGWRDRGGHPAFKIAREAEARGDWAEVANSCTQALAADPGHLDASWLLAVAHAKRGHHDRVLTPLQLAAAGDFGKWGPASLELPGMQAFLATPTGQAWRRRVEDDQASYVAALARSTLVFAKGDLYAWDPEASRWYRVTRTNGAVVGAIRFTPARIAYVARKRDTLDDKKWQLGIGLVDLTRGKSSRPLGLGTTGPVVIAQSPQRGVWIGSGGKKPTLWRQLDDEYRMTALPPNTVRPAGAWLEVKGKTVRRNALVSGIAADWDDRGFASAIRIARSNRIVSVPSPGLIAGSSIAWSPDRSHLAFVAQLAEQCPVAMLASPTTNAGSAAPPDPAASNAAAFVVDATTGAIQEIERAERGLALEWRDDRKLVVAGDHGVSVVDLDGAAPFVIAGAEGLLAPRLRPKCIPPEPAADELPPEDEPDVTGAGSAAAKP
ncbi:MAG: hypothetical protein WKG01_40835 [Kofleriaceae bacterium]